MTGLWESFPDWSGLFKSNNVFYCVGSNEPYNLNRIGSILESATKAARTLLDDDKQLLLYMLVLTLTF